MTTWTEEDLRTIGEAEELEIASYRDDGTLRKYVIIWAVRVADGVYVRSANGAESPWYRRALASGRGRIRTGGIERDVTFAAADASAQAAIDAAYHVKYDRYGAAVVDPVTGPHRYDVTIRLVPATA